MSKGDKGFGFDLVGVVVYIFGVKDVFIIKFDMILVDFGKID